MGISAGRQTESHFGICIPARCEGILHLFPTSIPINEVGYMMAKTNGVIKDMFTGEVGDNRGYDDRT